MHPVYWGAVVLTSICGTIATDGLHDNLNVDLWAEILVFGVLMMATFTIWLVVEKTLAIHSIYTLRRELFYWCVRVRAGEGCGVCGRGREVRGGESEKDLHHFLFKRSTCELVGKSTPRTSNLLKELSSLSQ